MLAGDINIGNGPTEDECGGRPRKSACEEICRNRSTYVLGNVPRRDLDRLTSLRMVRISSVAPDRSQLGQGSPNTTRIHLRLCLANFRANPDGEALSPTYCRLMICVCGCPPDKASSCAPGEFSWYCGHSTFPGLC